MIGTVPVYDSVIHYQRDLATLTAQDFVDVVRSMQRMEWTLSPFTVESQEKQ